MGDTEPPRKMLPKAKHTSSSILSYKVRLDPIATSYLVGWIEPATFLARSELAT